MCPAEWGIFLPLHLMVEAELISKKCIGLKRFNSVYCSAASYVSLFIMALVSLFWCCHVIYEAWYSDMNNIFLLPNELTLKTDLGCVTALLVFLKFLYYKS
jgi:hypothetical protein